MRKILVLSFIALLFVACNFVKDAAKFKPDLEVTFITPLAATLYVADTVSGTEKEISSIDFKARNSVDCTVEKIIIDYRDEDGSVFYGPFYQAIYMKVSGIVDPESVTVYSIANIPLAADKVAKHMLQNNLLVTRAYIGLVSEDDYGMGRTDTAWAWFGFNFINQ